MFLRVPCGGAVGRVGGGGKFLAQINGIANMREVDPTSTFISLFFKKKKNWYAQALMPSFPLHLQQQSLLDQKNKCAAGKSRKEVRLNDF